jgi:glycosyltransferase involved in cell wall biosynthesis
MEPKRSFYLANGVDFDHFAAPRADAPPEYDRLQRPIAVYAGALAPWFDFKLVQGMARRFPGVSFVLIGPEGYARTRLNGQKNLHLLGPRPYEGLPAYLQHADVGLIPFDVNGHADLIHRVQPLKLYEYLACGLPVVARDWEELRNLKSPAFLAGNESAFAEGIEQALAADQPKEPLLAYARNNTWDSSLERLLDYLEEM